MSSIHETAFIIIPLLAIHVTVHHIPKTSAIFQIDSSKSCTASYKPLICFKYLIGL